MKWNIFEASKAKLQAAIYGTVILRPLEFKLIKEYHGSVLNKYATMTFFYQNSMIVVVMDCINSLGADI